MRRLFNQAMRAQVHIKCGIPVEGRREELLGVCAKPVIIVSQESSPDPHTAGNIIDKALDIAKNADEREIQVFSSPSVYAMQIASILCITLGIQKVASRPGLRQNASPAEINALVDEIKESAAKSVVLVTHTQAVGNLMEILTYSKALLNGDSFPYAKPISLQKN